MTTINVGSTLSIQFLFDIDGERLDPDTLTGQGFKQVTAGTFPTTPDFTFTPTQTSTGLYTFTWVTSEAGIFKLSLLGEFNDATPDIQHYEYFIIGDVDPTNTLDGTYIITALGVLDPVYIDPEYILNFYPEGDRTEIAEIIWRKSLELESRIGRTNLSSLTSLEHDFIAAATMCELSRMYGLTNSGLRGFSGADSFKLGDLEVDRSASSSSGRYDLGNADTWCELAIALKAQLASASDKMRAVVPGAIYESPIPSRALKSNDF